MSRLIRFTSCVMMLQLSLAVALGAQQTVVAPAETNVPAEPRAVARPAVAVLEFDYAAVKEQWPVRGPQRGASAIPTIDPRNVGTGVANLLVDELTSGGEIRLIERQRLADVAREREGG